MKVKKLMLAVFALFLCLALVSCGGIEDTNGADDFSLVTINDDNIIKGMSSSSIASVSKKINEKGTIKIKSFSGVREIEAYNKAGTLTVSVTTTEGNLRVVLCTADEIIKDFDINAANQTFEIKDAGERVKLKIAGESAKFEIEYSFE